MRGFITRFAKYDKEVMRQAPSITIPVIEVCKDIFVAHVDHNTLNNVEMDLICTIGCVSVVFLKRIYKGSYCGFRV